MPWLMPAFAPRSSDSPGRLQGSAQRRHHPARLEAAEEDNRRGGQVKEYALATGLATTAFLNSFGPDKVLGASATQLLLGVGRPGLSRGLIEDVRDALEAPLWYMRLEGGRYRFTTEPNLNKVVLEREGAIGDDRIETLLRDAIAKVAPAAPELRVEPRVHASADLPDRRSSSSASSILTCGSTVTSPVRPCGSPVRYWSTAGQAGGRTRTPRC